MNAKMSLKEKLQSAISYFIWEKRQIFSCFIHQLIVLKSWGCLSIC